MRSIYHIRCGETQIAIADTSEMTPLGLGIEGWMVHRINVPKEYRGQGLGSQLLRMLCDDADALGETLILEPAATGGLSQSQLEAWYRRYGFESDPDWQGLMVREPRL